jgi:opacity protein-like surface antigen
MKKVLFSIITACIISGSAMAADWQHAFTDGNVYVFVDGNSIQKPGKVNRATIWTKFVSSTPEYVDGIVIEHSIYHEVYDCQNRTYAIMAIFNYNGLNLTSANEFSDLNWRTIIPDSNNEVLLRIACAK